MESRGGVRKAVLVNYSDEEDEEVDPNADWKTCEVCETNFETETNYFNHIRGLGHMNRVEESKRIGLGILPQTESNNKKGSYPKPAKVTNEQNAALKKTWFYCEICDIGFNTQTSYDVHVSGNFHADRVKRSNTVVMEGGEYDDTDNMAGSGLPTQFSSYQKNKPCKDDDSMTALQGSLSREFTCEVCSIKCTGIKSYNMHMEGQKHKKNLRKLTNGDVTLSRLPSVNPLERPKLLIQSYIDKCTEPLIGLDYITEFQRRKRREEPVYTCDLCASRMDPRQVINHVLGVRHRRRYLKYNYPEKHAEFCDASAGRPTAAAGHLAEIQARAVARREGRRASVRLRVELSQSDAKERIGEVNLLKLSDGSVWQEYDEFGWPKKSTGVVSGPFEFGGYLAIKPGVPEDDVTIVADHTPLRTRFPVKQEEDVHSRHSSETGHHSSSVLFDSRRSSDPPLPPAPPPPSQPLLQHPASYNTEPITYIYNHGLILDQSQASAQVPAHASRTHAHAPAGVTGYSSFQHVTHQSNSHTGRPSADICAQTWTQDPHTMTANPSHQMTSHSFPNAKCVMNPNGVQQQQSQEYPRNTVYNTGAHPSQGLINGSFKAEQTQTLFDSRVCKTGASPPTRGVPPVMKASSPRAQRGSSTGFRYELRPFNNAPPEPFLLGMRGSDRDSVADFSRSFESAPSAANAPWSHGTGFASPRGSRQARDQPSKARQDDVIRSLASVVANENDAELALKVSSQLTNAVLQYKTQKLIEEMKQKREGPRRRSRSRSPVHRSRDHAHRDRY